MYILFIISRCFHIITFFVFVFVLCLKYSKCSKHFDDEIIRYKVEFKLCLKVKVSLSHALYIHYATTCLHCHAYILINSVTEKNQIYLMSKKIEKISPVIFCYLNIFWQGHFFRCSSLLHEGIIYI